MTIKEYLKANPNPAVSTLNWAVYADAIDLYTLKTTSFTLVGLLNSKSAAEKFAENFLSGAQVVEVKYDNAAL